AGQAQAANGGVAGTPEIHAGDGPAEAAAGLRQAGRDPAPRSRCGAGGGREAGRDRGAGLSTLVFLEAPGDELSQQAMAFARQLGDDIAPVAVAGDAAYAPAAWGRALADAASQRGASAMVAPGTERGNEVLAHVAAIL